MIRTAELAEYLCFRLAFRPGSWKVSGRSRMRRIAQLLPISGLALALVLSIGACAGPGIPGPNQGANHDAERAAAGRALAAAQLAALDPDAVHPTPLVAQ